MGNHTIGPWKVNGRYIIVPVAADSVLHVAVARVAGDNDEAQANADIIAAAPELDEAAAEAWKALAWIINYDSEDKALARAMAVIEAARKKAGTFDYDAMRSAALAKSEGRSDV